MTIQRNRFFLLFLLLITMPFIAVKILWLANTVKTDGVMSYMGKSYNGQLVKNYAVIRFTYNGKIMWVNGPDNVVYEKGAAVSVRYPPGQPQEAALNTFMGIWGDSLVFAGVPVVMLLIVFLHPGIFPYRSKFMLSRTTPFITVIMNK